MKKSIIKIVILVLAIILVIALFRLVLTATKDTKSQKESAITTETTSTINTEEDTSNTLSLEETTTEESTTIEESTSNIVNNKVKKEDFLDTDMLTKISNLDGIFQVYIYKDFAVADNLYSEEAQISTNLCIKGKDNIFYAKNEMKGTSSIPNRTAFKYAEAWYDPMNNLAYFSSDGKNWYYKSGSINISLNDLDTKYNLKDYADDLELYIDEIENIYCLIYEVPLSEFYYNIPEECYTVLSSTYIALHEAYLSKDVNIKKDATVTIKFEFGSDKSFKGISMLLEDAVFDLTAVAGENATSSIKTLSVKLEYQPLKSLEIDKQVIQKAKLEGGN